MLTKQFYVLAGALLTLALTVAACDTSPAAGGSAPTGAASRTLSPAPVLGGDGTGEAAGVEAALVTYSDATQHFAVGHPGTWTQNTTATAGVRFDGGDDSMRLTFVTVPAGTDVLAYAGQDVAAATAAFPGFAQVGLARSPDVAGAVVLGFTAQGTSAVTGKAYAARGDRYYVPMADGRLAVLTVVGPTAHYDTQGVRDIALTIRSLK